jgi:hypothetical protein
VEAEVDDLDASLHHAGIRLSDDPHRKIPAVTGDEAEIRRRIAELVDSVKDDRARSQELFRYVWTMMCVRRGLMRVVREVHSADGMHLIVEEVKTGEHRVVPRPRELDHEIEGLAVQALSHILDQTRRSA